jgi:hypothetical protein
MNWSLPFAWPPPAPKDLPFELAVRMGVAAGISLYIARAVGLHYPEYTLLAVATRADVHPDGSWLRLHRRPGVADYGKTPKARPQLPQ